MENSVHFYIKRLKDLCVLYYEEEIIVTLLLSSENSTVAANNASSAAGKSTGHFFLFLGDGRKMVHFCYLGLVLKI